jgi:hypothetical protein
VKSPFPFSSSFISEEYREVGSQENLSSTEGLLVEPTGRSVSEVLKSEEQEDEGNCEGEGGIPRPHAEGRRVNFPTLEKDGQTAEEPHDKTNLLRATPFPPQSKQTSMISSISTTLTHYS